MLDLSISLYEVLSLSRWLFTSRRHSHFEIHIYHKQTCLILRSSDVRPQGSQILPVGEVKQQGAPERRRLPKHSTDQRETLECDVVKSDRAAYLNHAPSVSSRPSLIHLFTCKLNQSPIYLL